MSSFLDCLSKQHDLLDCVYQIRTARQKAATGSVNIARKCLVKSEKVTVPDAFIWLVGSINRTNLEVVALFNPTLS